MLLSFDFEGLFFIQIAKLYIIFVSEQCVIVEIKFRIKRVQLAVFGQEKRVDLRKRRVEVNEGAIQRRHKSSSLANHLVWQTDSEGELARLKRLKPNSGIDRFLQDFFRLVGGHFLDIHSAC